MSRGEGGEEKQIGAPSQTEHGQIDLCVCVRACALADTTCAFQTLQRGGESFGAGQQVVLELGQAFSLRHLHADLVLLLREAGALAIQQELRRVEQDHFDMYTHTHTVTN